MGLRCGFFFSSRRRHTRSLCDWSSDVCSSDLMLAHVLRAAIAEVPGLDPHDIGDVVVGCAMPEGEQGMNVARIGVLLAGLPNSVPAVTINRFCASGVQAVSMAADRIRAGDDDVVIAAGTESMSMVPMMGNKIALNQ